MSKKYSKVKAYFSSGRWSIARVRLAVEKEWITTKEFEEITGEKYEEDEVKEDE